MQQIRQFFAQRQVLEVETPLLASATVSDPHIESIASRTEPMRWLRTSPEYFHKRLLAAGSGDIYEIGKVFRAGEAGRWHNPEFTLLEWYRVGWHYQQLMDEVEALVRLLLDDSDDTWSYQRLSYRELHRKTVAIDPFELSPAQWLDSARAHGFDAANDEPLSTLQDFIYGVAVRQHLPVRTLTFVYDFPLAQAALARIRQSHPPVAERFELFMGRVEIANGYHELTNADEQRERFKHDLQQRQQRGQIQTPIDEQLLAALASGLPPCSGVALGIDRLLAQLHGADNLAEVLSFTHHNS